MKVDVCKKKQSFLDWKKRVQKRYIPGLSKINSSIIIQYVLDMEAGKNVSGKSAKGEQSYSQLCNLAQHMIWIVKELESRGITDLRECWWNELPVIFLFSDMYRGSIPSKHDSYGEYARIFKSFWHWWMEVNRKEGRTILDITGYLNWIEKLHDKE